MAVAQAVDMLSLARSRDTKDRERLLVAMADLCDSSPDARKPEIQQLLDDVFMTLVLAAERDIRRDLANRLACADWAPKALINMLARDEIEIARPLILSSPLIGDQDLIRLLVEATVEHQIEVARRPHLRAPVVGAILDAGDPAVMTALANNTSAELSEEAIRRLVDASRRIASLRSPLVRHPRLSSLLARQLYGWVGEALKSAIAERFSVDPAGIEQEVNESVSAAYSGGAAGPESGDERELMEMRLIDKLVAADQLRSSFLLKALKEGKLTLFQVALARLGDLSIAEVRRACNHADPELLALACAAVGIDRGAFPALLLMMRELNSGRPANGWESARRATAAFSKSPETAVATFRSLAAGA